MIGDLCLPLDDVEPPLHRERVAALLMRGYDVVASVHTATGRLTQADKCSTAALSTTALAAASTDAKRMVALRSGATTATIAAPPGTSHGAPAAAPPCPLRQLSRLHFVAADAVQAAQLGSSYEVVRSYDIVSITPKNERVLHQACTSLDVDIIALELTQRMGVKLRPAAVKAALRRGIYFEICYSPGLREPTARRNLFCNAQALVRATRGKNILLSSSARSAFEVRSPLEVLPMASLFGLTRKQAQDAISLATRAVLTRAAARLAGRGASAVAVSAAQTTTDIEMEDATQSEPPEQEQQPAVPQAQQQQQRAAGGRDGGRKRSAAVR